MLALEDVSLGYGPIPAVRNASLEVAEGQMVCLLGRNGAGKTTTLNGIVGLNRPTSGKIVFRDQDISRMPTSAIARLGLQYVPEGRGIFADLTVEQNLYVAGYAAGMTRRTAIQESDRVLSAFPRVAERRRQALGTMSGGEQQMVVLARALMARPRLLLLDEPALGLAPVVVHELYQQLIRLSTSEGVSVLVVEQYVDLALASTQFAYVLTKGEITVSVPSDDESAKDKIRAEVL